MNNEKKTWRVIIALGGRTRRLEDFVSWTMGYQLISRSRNKQKGVTVIKYLVEADGRAVHEAMGNIERVARAIGTVAVTMAAVAV